MLEVGLIGYGMAGRIFHAPLIGAVEGLRLRSIVQRRGDEARQRHPDVIIVRDANELISDDGIDLVVIATPNPSHFELASRALDAGKHVVVDKPFTVRSREASELVELAARRKRLLTVFHNRRWDGDFLTVRRLLDEKVVGRLVSLESRFDRNRSRARPGAWREINERGAGILYDLGSHLIDQALVAFGLPRSITADIRIERDSAAIDDAFEMWLHYEDFKVGLGAGMLVREPTPRFVLRGTDATYVKFGLDPQEAALRDGRSPSEPGWGTEPPERWGTLITDRGETKVETKPGEYTAFYENVRDAIRGSTALAVTPEAARMTIEIIEMALESSRQRVSIRCSAAI